MCGYPSTAPGQVQKHLELGGREAQPLAFDSRLITAGVHLKVTPGGRILIPVDRLLDPAEDRPHSGHERCRAHRHLHVVIEPGLNCGHQLTLVVLSGYSDNDGFGEAAQLAQQFRLAGAGQFGVDNN